MTFSLLHILVDIFNRGTNATTDSQFIAPHTKMRVWMITRGCVFREPFFSDCPMVLKNSDAPRHLKAFENYAEG